MGGLLLSFGNDCILRYLLCTIMMITVDSDGWAKIARKSSSE